MDNITLKNIIPNIWDIYGEILAFESCVVNKIRK